MLLAGRTAKSNAWHVAAMAIRHSKQRALVLEGGFTQSPVAIQANTRTTRRRQACSHDVPFTDSRNSQSVTTFARARVWVYSWLGAFVIELATSLGNSQPCCAAAAAGLGVVLALAALDPGRSLACS